MANVRGTSFVLALAGALALAVAACGGGGNDEGQPATQARITDPALVPTATPMQDPVIFRIQNDRIITESGAEQTVVAGNTGSSQPRRQTYTVEPGDTCSGIAAKLGVSVEELIRANRSIDESCTNLRVGDELVVPGGTTPGGNTQPAATPTPTPTRRSGSGTTYAVVEGDTCESIAERHGVSVSALLAANPSVGDGCTNLQIGQELNIP